jgi:hypothetical protein
VVLYGCETWSLTVREEHKLRVSETKVLRRIFGLKGDRVTGGWRKLHNEELHNFYLKSYLLTRCSALANITKFHPYPFRYFQTRYFNHSLTFLHLMPKIFNHCDSISCFNTCRMLKAPIIPNSNVVSTISRVIRWDTTLVLHSVWCFHSGTYEYCHLLQYRAVC